MFMGIMTDHDPVETQEWIDSLRSVVQYQGVERARFLLTKLRDESVRTGSRPAFTLTTPYINTILPPAI
jgi:pyruvate dehydrogenase E1 component